MIVKNKITRWGAQVAQESVTDLKIDFSRNYQPVTAGPGGGLFTYRAIDGAGGKRIATIAYLLPLEREPGAYEVEVTNKQQGKGRLSAYNESLARTIEEDLLLRMKAELYRRGWRQTRNNLWLDPERSRRAYEEDLLPMPSEEELEAPALIMAQSAPEPANSTPMAERYKVAVGEIIDQAERLNPNAVMLVSLPGDIYVLVLHGRKFSSLMELMTKAEAGF